VAANGLREPGSTSLLSVEAGDEVAGLAFEFDAFSLMPFAGDPDKLARAGKGADVLVQIDAGEAAALGSSVVFFPVADPFVGKGVGEAALRELVEGGLVAFEA
jgi:hypothetical protein